MIHLMEDEDEEDDDDYGSGSELDLAEEKAELKLLPKVKELVDKLCGSTKPSLCVNTELSYNTTFQGLEGISVSCSTF